MMVPPYRLAGHHRPTPEERRRHQKVVPYSQVEPLINELQTRFEGEGLNEIFQMVGYAAKPSKNDWLKYGAPLVAYNAIKGILADLNIEVAVRETILEPAPPPPEPEPEPDIPSNEGRLQPELPLANGTDVEPPEQLFDFTDCSALIALLMMPGIPVEEAQRRRLLKKLATELARQ